MKIKVGVIFGGPTVEHEVSVISAVQAMNNLNVEKYDIIPIYISKDRNWYTGKMLMDIEIYKDFEQLKKYAKRVVLYNNRGTFYLQSLKGFKRNIIDIDIVLPIVHGNNMEDGTLAGYLDMIGIPYIGSGVLGAALGQDKVVMKQIFEKMNIPIVNYTWFFDTDYYNSNDMIMKKINEVGYPVIVKPASLGSSVGITFVKDNSDIKDAIENAINYDKKIIVEKAVENLVEVNCSVLGNYEHQEVGALEEVMSTDEFLTYSDKYMGGKSGKSKGMASTNRVIPARISDLMTEKIINTSKEVFKALNLTGVCRIDYLIDSKNQKLYVNEPNTIPGSLSFYLWEPVGKKYDQLLDDLILLGIKEYKNKNKKTYSFETNILNGYNGLKMKGKLK